MKVSVVPETEYVDGSCTTPETTTKTEAVLAGATDMVNATVDPLPLNVSVTNATWYGWLPTYAMSYSYRMLIEPASNVSVPFTVVMTTRSSVPDNVTYPALTTQL